MCSCITRVKSHFLSVPFSFFLFVFSICHFSPYGAGVGGCLAQNNFFLYYLFIFYFLFFIWCCTTINHPFLKRSICPSSITPNAFHWLMVNQLNWRVVQLINSHVMCIAFEKWDLSRRLTVLLSSCEIIYMLLVWLSFVFSAPSLSAC